MYRIAYQQGWDEHLHSFDLAIQTQIAKKIAKLVHLEKIRHLGHGLPFFVVEANQYRICFEEKERMRTIVFVGNHKQYEKWYSEK